MLSARVARGPKIEAQVGVDARPVRLGNVALRDQSFDRLPSLSDARAWRCRRIRTWNRAHITARPNRSLVLQRGSLTFTLAPAFASNGPYAIATNFGAYLGIAASGFSIDTAGTTCIMGATVTQSSPCDAEITLRPRLSVNRPRSSTFPLRRHRTVKCRGSGLQQPSRGRPELVGPIRTLVAADCHRLADRGLCTSIATPA
jgi:hypothetical protein